MKKGVNKFSLLDIDKEEVFPHACRLSGECLVVATHNVPWDLPPLPAHLLVTSPKSPSQVAAAVFDYSNIEVVKSPPRPLALEG
jgi:hypothetical protein